MQIGDISQTLKLGQRQVEALESGDWKRASGAYVHQGLRAQLCAIDAAGPDADTGSSTVHWKNRSAIWACRIPARRPCRIAAARGRPVATGSSCCLASLWSFWPLWLHPDAGRPVGLAHDGAIPCWTRFVRKDVAEQVATPAATSLNRLRRANPPSRRERHSSRSCIRKSWRLPKRRQLLRLRAGQARRLPGACIPAHADDRLWVARRAAALAFGGENAISEGRRRPDPATGTSPSWFGCGLFGVLDLGKYGSIFLSKPAGWSTRVSRRCGRTAGLLLTMRSACAVVLLHDYEDVLTPAILRIRGARFRSESRMSSWLVRYCTMVGRLVGMSKPVVRSRRW